MPTDSLSIPGAAAPRVRVLIPMALGMLALGALRALVDLVPDPPLDLRPYLDAPRSLGLVSVSAWSVSAQAILFALASAGVFFLLEAVLRRAFEQPHEAAALLPAALFAVLPCQSALLRVAGGPELLLGLALASVGLALVLAESRFWQVVGGLLVLAAPLAHGAWVLAAVAVIPMRFSQTARTGVGWALGFSLAVMAGAVATGWFWGGAEFPAPPVAVGFGPDRRLFAWRGLVAAPVLAFDGAPGSFLPTGFAAYSGQIPWQAGAAGWGLLLGVAMLTAGIRRGAILGGLAAVGGLAPFLVPDWVPVDRRMLALPLLSAAGLLGCLLVVIRSRSAKWAMAGLALGLAGPVIVALKDSDERQVSLRSVRDLLSLERAGLGFVPAAEPDPARLLLYAAALAEDEAILEREHPGTSGTVGAYRDSTVRQAQIRLAASAWAVDRLALGRLAGDLALRIPASAPREDKDLFHRLNEVELAVDRLNKAMSTLQPEVWYATAQTEAQRLLPEVQELRYLSQERASREPRLENVLRKAKSFLFECARWASSVGELRYSVPLREALLDIVPIDASHEIRAQLGIELARTGRDGEAAEHLSAAARHVSVRQPLGVVLRGAQARILRRSGKNQEALDLLNAAWSGLGFATGGVGIKGLAGPDTQDYWILTEVLLDRWELARDLDPGLVNQARVDLERVVLPAVEFGVRRVPALAFYGRLLQLQGDLPRARQVLLEMRAIKPESFVARASGPSGRHDLPHYRRRGLTALRELLDPEKEPELVQAVEQELRDLDLY